MGKFLDPKKTGSAAEKLQGDLERMVVGQQDAIEQVVRLYQNFNAGLTSTGRPLGNLLFLGQSGSGKTRLVEATADSLLSNQKAMIKIDCGEFQHSHEIAKLIGSPPGYLGHRETHPLLSQEALNQHHTDKVKISIVLFDEIEKASNALWNLLLGILDKATLTLGDNRRVDFSRAMIFMTSNLGAAEMSRLLSPGMGFTIPQVDKSDKNGERIKRTGLESARKNFTPEFMNRLDSIVVFKTLTESDIDKIFDLELNIVQQRIYNTQAVQPFMFKLTTVAKKYLLKNSVDDKYGARHIKRTIERMLINPLSNLVSSEQIHGGDIIEVDYNEEADLLTFEKIEENVAASRLLSEFSQVIEQPKPVTGKPVDPEPQASVIEPKRAVIPYVKRPTKNSRRRRTGIPLRPSILNLGK